MCGEGCAKTPCLVSHILCPHLRPCPIRMGNPEAHWLLVVFNSLLLFAQVQTLLHHQTRGWKSATATSSTTRFFLEGDPILSFFFCPLLPWRLLGGLAGSGATLRALASERLRLDRLARKLMNCRQDATRQPAKRSGKRPSRAITVCPCDGGNQRDSADNLI